MHLQTKREFRGQAMNNHFGSIGTIVEQCHHVEWLANRLLSEAIETSADISRLVMNRNCYRHPAIDPRTRLARHACIPNSNCTPKT
jgi:hypothetical protein